MMEFTDGQHTVTGVEVTWKSLPKETKKHGGEIEYFNEENNVAFVEIGDFSALFFDHDFDDERIFSLSNGQILSAGELQEEGWDWS